VTEDVYPKRSIFRVLLELAWERGEYHWSGNLQSMLRVEEEQCLSSSRPSSSASPLGLASPSES